MPFNIFQKLIKRESHEGQRKRSAGTKQFPDTSRRSVEESAAKSPRASEEEQSAKKEKAASVHPKGASEMAWQLLVAPRISEKSSAHQWYVFEVAARATKPLLKKAIEDRYHVKVAKIRMVQSPEKFRRHGKILGKKPGFKKAIVILKSGNTIEEL